MNESVARTICLAIVSQLFKLVISTSDVRRIYLAERRIYLAERQMEKS